MSRTATEEAVFAESERERMMRAVTELIAERGFAEITVATIVERAGGTTEEAFEKLFGSVEDCLVAACNAVTAQILAAVSGAYSADLSEWESGLRGIRAILELMATDPSSAYLGYIGARQMGSARTEELYWGGTQMLAVMIERLWEYSSLEEQPRAAARAALGGAEALVRAELMAGRAERLPRLLPDLVYGATVAFLGQEEALRLARRGRELLAGSEWG